jgi:hypothetical protein
MPVFGRSFPMHAVVHRQTVQAQVYSDTLAWSGAGSLSVTSTLSQADTLAWSGAATMSVTITLTEQVALSWSAAGSMAASLTLGEPASLAWSGAGTMVATPTLTQQASVGWSGTSSLSIAATLSQAATLAWSSTGSMAVSAWETFQDTLAWSGASSMSLTAVRVQPESLSWQASSVFAIGVSQQTYASQIAWAGVATMFASASGTVRATVAWTGGATAVFGTPVDISATSLAWTAAGTASFTGLLIAIANAAWSGAGSLTLGASLQEFAGVILAGAATAFFGAMRTAVSSLTWSGAGLMSIAAVLQHPGMLGWAGVGLLQMGVFVNQPLSLEMLGLGGMTIDPSGTSTTPGYAPQQPYYVRDPQGWAIEQERMRHDQALYQIGEMSIFILMWTELDFKNGLVNRCKICYASSDPIQNRIAAVYNQPTKNRCPDCFGTTFEGGYRARIVRPVVITDVDETENLDRRGSTHPADINVETTWDFRSRNGDYLVRSDGSRWRLDTPQRTTLRSGFGHPTQLTTEISYGNIRGHLEELTTVSYLIPPTNVLQFGPELRGVQHYPPQFPELEDVRGSLIPMSTVD